MASSGSNRDSALAVIPNGCFWGKLGDEGADYHPLFAHCADVAAVVARLLQPDSVLAARLARSAGLDSLSAGVIAQLTYVATLHDLGKTNNGFQNQRHRGAPRSPGHVRIVLESLGHRPLAAVWRDLIAPLGAPPAQAHDLLCTGLCHHGRPMEVRSTPIPNVPIWQVDARSGRDPLAEIRRLADHARNWSGLDPVATPAPLPLTPTFLHLFAGTLTLADWIGSTRAAFDFAPDAENDPDGYWGRAQVLARSACSKIGLTPETTTVSLEGLPLLSTLFPRVFGAGGSTDTPPAAPTPLQAHVAEMELPAFGSRVLIESETGSGKTEAALALYARLRAERRVGGLVFALPTRSTARAMHERVQAAVSGMYRPGDRPTTVLAMGGEQSRIEFTAGEPGSKPLVENQPITYPEPEDAVLVHWSSSSAKKFFAAEIVVGTIDQVLLGGLTVKHAHLRLAAFSRHLLVVDELHSYDAYMAEVLQRVLDAHAAFGGIALLMSATLSDRERLRFGGAPTSQDEQTPYATAVTRPYPLVSVCEQPGESWIDTKLDSPRSTPKPPLRWNLCGEESGLTHAIRGAESGARVCILRNTVRGARETVSALHALRAAHILWRPEGSLHTPAYHSRYTPADRLALDSAVLDSYGRNRIAGNGRILVATQVVEQSLDVDFDLLITDLCPVDVLLQRLGRVWRHRERDASRPESCRAANAWVIEPPDGLEALLGKEFGFPNGWGSVYEHLGLLELTRRTILESASVEALTDSRRLVESVYHADRQQALRIQHVDWDSHFSSNEGKAIAKMIAAAGSVIAFNEAYIANAERFLGDATNSLRTRLGDDRVRVALPAPLPGHYDPAHPADFVDLPFLKLTRSGLTPVELSDPRASMATDDPDGAHFQIGKFRFAYTPQGWQYD